MTKSNTKPKALLLQPFDESAAHVSSLVKAAAEIAGVQVLRLVEMPAGGLTVQEAIKNLVESCDIVIADLTNSNPNVMMEFGMAISIGKPIIVIGRSIREVPPGAARATLFLAYGSSEESAYFLGRLSSFLKKFSSGGTKPSAKSLAASQPKDHKVFISYCHADKSFLDRLLIHLRPIERAGKLEVWADTHLRVGDRWKKEIEAALARSNAAVLLISADFMASDFITNNELPPLLRAAEENGTKILPLLVKPSRFARDDNLKHFQAINDPRNPLVSMNESERESVLDQLAEEIERWMKAA